MWRNLGAELLFSLGWGGLNHLTFHLWYLFSLQMVHFQPNWRRAECPSPDLHTYRPDKNRSNHKYQTARPTRSYYNYHNLLLISMIKETYGTCFRFAKLCFSLIHHLTNMKDTCDPKRLNPFWHHSVKDGYCIWFWSNAIPFTGEHPRNTHAFQQSSLRSMKQEPHIGCLVKRLQHLAGMTKSQHWDEWWVIPWSNFPLEAWQLDYEYEYLRFPGIHIES